MSFENQTEKQTELNSVFKSTIMDIVNPDGRVSVGREHAGCYAAIVIFNSPQCKEPLKASVKNKKLDKCDVLAPEIIQMFSSNPQTTPREVARSLGVDTETVNRAIGKINLKMPGRIKAPARERLWLDIVPKVQEILNQDKPVSQSELARQLKVHRDTVARAVVYINQNKNGNLTKA